MTAGFRPTLPPVPPPLTPGARTPLFFFLPPSHRAAAEGKALEQQFRNVDQAYVRTANEVQELNNEMLARLSEQMTVEKAAQKTVQSTRELRKKVRDQELNSVNLQNELAKVEVDTLNTEAHIQGLEQTLGLLDKEVDDKLRAIEKHEVEIRRRNDEIEKKTKMVDVLNKQYERLTANQTDDNMGPLEATIHNLQKEISQKAVEGKELQRRWIAFQTELVQVLSDNNAAEERVQRKKAEHTVLYRKRLRLEQQYDHHVRGIKELDQAMARLQGEMGRLNQLIAKNVDLQRALESDTFNLENRILNDLKEMEADAAHLEGSIEAGEDEKRELLATLVEMERQVMLWERKLQLEREMQEAIDPDAGNEIVTAMKKEIHRMQVRLSELRKLQERLIADLERGITKREVITTRGRSMQASAKGKKGAAPDPTEAGQRKAVAQLKQSIRDTDRETQSTEQRIKELEAMRAKVAEDSEKVSSRCYALRSELEDVRLGLDKALSERQRAVMATSKTQRLARKLEDFLAGRYTPSTLDREPAVLAEELDRSLEKRERLVQAIQAMRQTTPKLASAFDRLLLQLG